MKYCLYPLERYSMGVPREGTGGLDPLENNKLLYVSMGHHGEAFGPLWFLKKSTCAA